MQKGKDILLLHGTLLIYAVVSVFAKLAGLNLAAQEMLGTVFYLGLECLCLLVYSLLWQQVLKRMPLHFAFANKGVCTLWTALLGVIIFGETLTAGKAVGLAVVLIGVGLVVTDRE